VPPDVRARVAAHRGRRRAEVRRGEAVKKKAPTKDVEDRTPVADGGEAALVQAPPPEQIYADELAHLAAWDAGARPPSWRLTPRAVVTFIIGSQGEALRAAGSSRVIGEKFVGERALVERCVVTLAGERGLLLVGDRERFVAHGAGHRGDDRGAPSLWLELLAADREGTAPRGARAVAGARG